MSLHDSEAPLTSTSPISNSTLENLLNPDDSASNVVPLPAEADKVYDINDPSVLNLLMGDETVDFQVIDNIHYAVSDNRSVLIDPSIFNLFI